MQFLTQLNTTHKANLYKTSLKQHKYNIFNMVMNLKKFKNYLIFKYAFFLYIVTGNNYDITTRAPNIFLIQHGLNNLKSWLYNNTSISMHNIAFTLSATYKQPYNKHN